MSGLYKILQHPIGSKIFLCVLIGAALAYTLLARYLLSIWVLAPSSTVVEYTVNANPSTVMQHWTSASMLSATNEDTVATSTTTLDQEATQTDTAQASKQAGQPSSNTSLSYPTSTVGKIFFTDKNGQSYVCSGTAVVSLNHNVVDTAGHCIYHNGTWMQNLIFCPLYNNGDTPYGCWAARALEAPADWINARANDYHHDLGMVIVSPNDAGNLTDVVGGVGWAYNQSESQTFYAYGYPAASPFNGQTRRSCENVSSTSWQHSGGTVISIPCNMTGGSSGGPWFVQINGQWYLNGHNDFTSTIQRGHMFSPYYDDTWSTLYNKAEHS